MPRGRPHSCPYCNSTKTICKGWRITKYQGKRRIKLCKSCSRKFTPKNQKPIEPTEEKDAESDTGSAVESEKGKAVDAAPDDPKPLLNSLDEEWTS